MTIRFSWESAVNIQGRTKEAEALYRKALSVIEVTHGNNHPATAAIYDNIAVNLRAQGREREAEPLLRKALAVSEKVSGVRSLETGKLYNNLAINLLGQGRGREAEPLLRQAMSINEESLGSRDLSTATSYANLASYFDDQGRTEEAESLHRKAVAITEHLLGGGHWTTAMNYNNLAANLQAQGRYRESEPLHRKALATFEKQLGSSHQFVAVCYHNLADDLNRQGMVLQAEPLFRKSLAIMQEARGPRHVDTLDCLNALAHNLSGQGRRLDAERLYRTVLAIREDMLGPRDPTTANSMISLAMTLERNAGAREAEVLLRKAVVILEESVGANHTDCARCYQSLAGNLGYRGRAKDAEPLLRKALAIEEQTRGVHHLATGICYGNLASNLGLQGRLKEAETFDRKSLAVLENTLGPYHRATALAYDALAYNLALQGRGKEAEPLWQFAANGIEISRHRLAATAIDKASVVGPHSRLGLATYYASMARPSDAWHAAEMGLARGLLDDLPARVGLSAVANRSRRDQDVADRLDAIDRSLIPLLTANELSEAGRTRRDEFLKERADLIDETARATADTSRQAILPIELVQVRLLLDEVLIFWLDWSATLGADELGGDHWACVIRRIGQPTWVRILGSGPKGTWVTADNSLPRRLRAALARGEPDAADLARKLAAQRLDPLAPHLAATADLPAVRRLIVLPFGDMAGVPIETLTDRYLISYAPSGTVFTRLRERHRSLDAPTLLAVGDPNFALPNAGPPPMLPERGLYLALVLPDGNAAKAGLRVGDVLLQYGEAKLSTKADLKTAEGDDRIPVVYWRDGKTETVRLPAGKLGVVIPDETPAVALRQRRERDIVADSRDRSEVAPLPGTKLEVAAVAGLLPADAKATVLLGSDASEQRLDQLAASGELKKYRLLHFATHGTVDPSSAARSHLELARDKLSGPDEQAKLAAAGKKVHTGKLYVETVANEWQLDADLVALSACETALGPDGGGEGLLGFSQVLLGRGARSLLLSLWKVDDTATALLMTRFYENLLKKKQPKAEALRDAKKWLRELPRAEVEALAGRLAKGELRGTQVKVAPTVAGPSPGLPAGAMPFAHPR